MKKLLLGSITLFLFSASIMLFQMSCKKEAIAQNNNYTLPPATTSTLGGVIVGSGLQVTSNGTLSTTGSSGQVGKILYSHFVNNDHYEYWTANYDGTNQLKINYTLPAHLKTNDGAALSKDGQTLFFGVRTIAPPFQYYIYACNIDGTNLRQILDGGNDPDFELMGAY